MDAHILIVDSDPLHCKMLTFLLADADFQTSTLADPRGIGAHLQRNAVHVILLDVANPSVEGFALCAQLRREHVDTPVIIVSERGTTADIVRGFNQGADDYIIKPYEPAELLAASRPCFAATGASTAPPPAHWSEQAILPSISAELSFTPASGRTVLITPTEMRMLECMMRSANAVIPRNTLIEHTWGYDSENADNRIDVYIRRLRHKIEANPNDRNLIRTIRGVGYTFTGDQADERDSA